MKYTDQTIRMISSQISEYDAGCKLYAASAVHDTKYNDKTDIYFALVNEHGHDYHVYVKTADTEDGMRYHCDCPSSRELAGPADIRSLYSKRFRPLMNIMTFTWII